MKKEKKNEIPEKRLSSSGTMVGMLFDEHGGHAEILMSGGEIKRISRALREIELSGKNPDKKYVDALDVVFKKMSNNRRPLFLIRMEACMGAHRVKFNFIPREHVWPKE